MKLSDFTQGDLVEYWRPNAIGVLAHGNVERIGRKYLYVGHGVCGCEIRIYPGDVWQNFTTGGKAEGNK